MKSLASLLLVLGSAFAFNPVRAADTIVSEGIIDAPVGAVWAAWTTSEGLRAWVAPHADIDLRLDGLMRTNYNPQGTLGDPGTIENRILAYEPERLFSIRVAKTPDKFPFKAVIGEMWTVLYLEPTADGKTRLRIAGLGFGPGEESQKMKAFFQQGNDYTLTMLQKHFKR